MDECSPVCSLQHKNPNLGTKDPSITARLSGRAELKFHSNSVLACFQPSYISCKHEKALERILEPCGKHTNAHECCLMVGYCMTYDKTTQNALLGKCPYHHNYKIIGKDQFNMELNTSFPNLTQFMCDDLLREGTLCGKCENAFLSLRNNFHFN